MHSRRGKSDNLIRVLKLCRHSSAQALTWAQEWGHIKTAVAILLKIKPRADAQTEWPNEHCSSLRQGTNDFKHYSESVTSSQRHIARLKNMGRTFFTHPDNRVGGPQNSVKSQTDWLVHCFACITITSYLMLNKDEHDFVSAIGLYKLVLGEWSSECNGMFSHLASPCRWCKWTPLYHHWTYKTMREM